MLGSLTTERGWELMMVITVPFGAWTWIVSIVIKVKVEQITSGIIFRDEMGMEKLARQGRISTLLFFFITHQADASRYQALRDFQSESRDCGRGSMGRTQVLAFQAREEGRWEGAQSFFLSLPSCYSSKGERYWRDSFPLESGFGDRFSQITI